MPTHIANRVRFAFCALMLSLLFYTGVDTALARGTERGTKEAGCGAAGAPCRLAPYTVPQHAAPPADAAA